MTPLSKAWELWSSTSVMSSSLKHSRETLVPGKKYILRWQYSITSGSRILLGFILRCSFLFCYKLIFVLVMRNSEVKCFTSQLTGISSYKLTIIEGATTDTNLFSALTLMNSFPIIPKLMIITFNLSEFMLDRLCNLNFFLLISSEIGSC